MTRSKFVPWTLLLMIAFVNAFHILWAADDWKNGAVFAIFKNIIQPVATIAALLTITPTSVNVFSVSGRTALFANFFHGFLSLHNYTKFRPPLLAAFFISEHVTTFVLPVLAFGGVLVLEEILFSLVGGVFLWQVWLQPALVNVGHWLHLRPRLVLACFMLGLAAALLYIVHGSYRTATVPAKFLEGQALERDEARTMSLNLPSADHHLEIVSNLTLICQCLAVLVLALWLGQKRLRLSLMRWLPNVTQRAPPGARMTVQRDIENPKDL